MSKQRRFKRFRLLERRLTDEANRLRERAKRDEAGPVAFVDVAKFADFAGRSSHLLEMEASRTGQAPIRGQRVASVPNFFQADDYACWLRPVHTQRCEVSVVPKSESYYLAVLSYHSRDLKQLQYVQSLNVEKKGVLPKQFAEMNDCGIILRKDLRFKLSQSPVYLSFA
jgi:hypothetical protein